MPATRVVAVLVSAAVVCSALAGCAPAVVTPVAATPSNATSPYHDCPWESVDGDHPQISADALDLEETESRALPEEHFWSLIDLIPSDPEPADFLAVSKLLGNCSPDDIFGFEARMTIALYELDGPENLAWYEANRPEDIGIVTDEDFLYARAATVLAGQEVWTDAVAGQTLGWGDDAPDLDGGSESLLYVAADAARATGMSDDDFYDTVFLLIPLSYETGGNFPRWDADPDAGP